MTIKLEVDIYGEKNIFLLKKEHKERERVFRGIHKDKEDKQK